MQRTQTMREVIELHRGDEALNRIAELVSEVARRMGSIYSFDDALNFAVAFRGIAEKKGFPEIALTITRILEEPNEKNRKIEIAVEFKECFDGKRKVELFLGENGVYYRLGNGALSTSWNKIFENPSVVESIVDAAFAIRLVIEPLVEGIKVV